jgi:integrase
MTKISEKTVNALAIGKRITDELIEGFVARRLPSGKVSFGYQYTDHATGARRWMGIGLHGALTSEEARARAKEFAGLAVTGKDPAHKLKVDKARAENTVDHVLDEFLRIHVAKDKLRSAINIEQNLANHVRPLIGSKVIYDLRRSDIAAITDKLAHRRRIGNVVLGHLRAAFNWWQLRDEDFRTPIVRGMVKKNKGDERTRVLAPDELADIWRACERLEKVPACFGAYIKVLFLTACRRTEVARMHTDEIDGNTWAIPAVRYKTDKDHVVALIPAIKKLLPTRKNGFVFSTDGGTTALAGFGEPKDEIDRVVAEIRRREGRKPMAPWVLHDLRRTARTMMAELKIEDRVAEAVLGHVIPGVEARYNKHHYLTEKTEALAKLAAHVDRLVGPAARAAKVRLVAG